MSTLSVNSIFGTNNNIILPNSGSVIQTVFTRTDAFTLYSGSVTGDGTTITDLSLTITPTSANSRIIIQWMIQGDVSPNSDIIFLVHKNGLLINDTGELGRNSISNNRWVGFSMYPFDSDFGSTQSQIKMQYSQIAGTTQTRTYSPAVRSSSATAQTFYLNRCVASAGADNLENGVSYGFAFEVVG